MEYVLFFKNKKNESNFASENNQISINDSHMGLIYNFNMQFYNK